MSEALTGPVEFGPEQMTLGTELLRVLTAGDATRLKELLRREVRPQAESHVAIEVNGAFPAVAPPSVGVGTGCLLGVTSNGNTALHLVASRGHAELAALVCERAPSLVATRNRGLDTPLHCAAKAGSRDVAACLLSQMRAAAAGGAEAAALRARNRLGATALHEAVRLSRAAVVDLLITKAPELASVTTDDGVSPLYLAAEIRSEKMVRLLLRPSADGTPSPALFAGRHGRTALHAAATVSEDILNAADYEGNTPLHLAVKCGFPQIVSLLLQMMSVDIGITNKDGLSVQDLASHAVTPARWCYFLDPHFIVLSCLCWLGIGITMDQRYPLDQADPKDLTEETSDEEHDMLRNGAIGSVLIATVAFAAPFTVPRDLIADDHRSAGTAVLARRFAFRAFVVSDTMAFLCFIMATSFLIYGGAARENPRGHGLWYKILASRLMPVAARFMIAAFAFGFHLVLGDANRGLVVFVYLVSMAPVLFCFPDVWVPLQLLGVAKAVWRRAGWRGLVNVHKRPMSLLHLVQLLVGSFLFQYLVGAFLVVLIAATFAVAIALNICLPNY